MLLLTVGVFLVLASVPLAVQVGGPLVLRRVPQASLIEDVYADIDDRSRRPRRAPARSTRSASLEDVASTATRALKRLFRQATSRS